MRIGLMVAVAATLALLRPLPATAQIQPSSGVQLLEEGSNIGTARTLNCVGAGISCSLAGGVGTLSVSGGGAGGSPPGGATGALQTNAGGGAFGGYAGSNTCSGGFATALSSAGVLTCGTGVVTSLTGTANQVIVSGSTGAVTLSGPQSLGTANAPQFGRLGLNTAPISTQGTLTMAVNANNVSAIAVKRFTDTSPTGAFLDFQTAAAASVYRVDITGKIAAYGGATPANGHLPIGNATTGFYEDGTIAGTANQVTVTNSAGGVTLALPSTVTLTNLNVTGAAPGAGTACVQISSTGAISNTGSTCGSGSAGVSSLNTLTGALSLAAGSNITITPSGGNTLTIAATGGAGGVTSLNSLTGALTLVAGSNVTITPSGSNITIAATSGGGTNASVQNTPADPAGTTSASFVHAGFGGTTTITPSNTGKIHFIASFEMKGTAVGNLNAQLRYGTGTAPTNGTAATGTLVGRSTSAISSAAGQQFPTTLNAVITGLTVSTTYWLDVVFASGSAGTVTMKNVSLSANEF